MKSPARLSCSVAALLLMLSTNQIGVAGGQTSPGSPASPGSQTAQGVAGSFELTIDSIMRGPKVVGYPPDDMRWSGDSSRLYFEWRRPDEEESGTWVVNKDGGGLRKLSDLERRSVPSPTSVWDAARRRALFVDDGDIVIVDSARGTRRSITRTTARESGPRWARNETAVTFVRENNLYLLPLEMSADSATDGLVQMTDVQVKRPDPRESESQKFLKTQEQALIEHTREAAEKRKKDEAEQKERALPKFDLRDRQSVTDALLTPDGHHAVLLVVERVEARRSDVPNYVTQTGYVESTPARIVVGESRDKQSLAVLNLKTGTSKPVEGAFAGENREVQWGMPITSKDGSLIVTNARATNNKDRWIVAVDAESGKVRIIDRQHDDAWVREVGGGGGASPSYGWLADQKHLWFLSERDGWMHLYSVDASAEGSQPRQLTRGNWEVGSVAMSLDRRTFYLTTNQVHPGERHVYSMPADGGSPTKLTSATGASEGAVSPDGSTIGLIHSYANVPPDLFVAAARAGATPKRVTTSPTDEWRSFKWVDPTVITYKARDGATVHARLYTPEMVGARRDPSAPAVVFVHGAGYLQNAHRYWSTYSREYMFHHLLASKGYVVLDPDFRASAGYGRDWRTAIYRHMGGKDLDDVVDGAKYLVDSEKVDAGRIGVYGGSYGGFITLMALFTSPDTFAAGAALRPVTDWAHYNHTYTSNILNEPHADPEAYRRSSPIYFAEGLKKPLLIAHGMIDNNVLFQDSVRLVQRLIELRKDTFETAVFPVENHSFEEETSWADEYKRVLRLFDTNLKGKP